MPEPTPDALAAASAAAHELATAIATTGEVLSPLVEATHGYRAARLAEGYTPAQAAEMSADYHGALIWLMRLGSEAPGPEA